MQEGSLPIACVPSALTVEERARSRELREELARAIEETTEGEDGSSFRYRKDAAIFVRLKPTEPFSLTGILRCPQRGDRILGKISGSSERRYYMCARRHLGGSDICSFPSIAANELQKAVWDWLHEVLSSPAFVR
ncbi:zinc ribbon domain-containing protein [Polyangium sp. 15x6]|uniref:zinc ribbon domain-containing protein n=1 Tax=Polyangium sp. 15x6 TaxID=3042687 RepID=UPI00249C5FFA|nr:zinc ribbon domain-containing protein [Polyangium sp. 15x6]MDI3289299.1 zinc ribbon domain-containing protein [Polyangium sp. 15x6]